MVREFKLTMDDYQRMELPQRLKVDAWLQKYDLTNVHTIVKTGDGHDGGDGVMCFGYNIFPFYRATEPMSFTSNADDVNGEVVSALFDYDDFPWEVLDV